MHRFLHVPMFLKRRSALKTTTKQGLTWLLVEAAGELSRDYSQPHPKFRNLLT
jgi:hypothetical protein